MDEQHGRHEERGPDEPDGPGTDPAGPDSDAAGGASSWVAPGSTPSESPTAPDGGGWAAPGAAPRHVSEPWPVDHRPGARSWTGNHPGQGASQPGPGPRSGPPDHGPVRGPGEGPRTWSAPGPAPGSNPWTGRDPGPRQGPGTAPGAWSGHGTASWQGGAAGNSPGDEGGSAGGPGSGHGPGPQPWNQPQQPYQPYLPQQPQQPYPWQQPNPPQQPHPQGAGPYPWHPVPPGQATGGGTPGGETARSWWGEAQPPPPSTGFGAESARRLSPRTMVVGPINQLRSLLLPVLAGLVLGGFNPWLLAATGMGVVVLLVGGFVTWRTFRYEVGADRVEISRGLIRRSRRTIPLERVRGVDVTSSLLHRLLGVAVVRIEAAAGSAAGTEDGKLDAVSAEEAERLRRVLLHRKAVLTEQESGPGAAVPGESGGTGGVPPTEGSATTGVPSGEGDPDETVTYFSMPRRWYLYGALSLGYLLTPFVVLATLFGMVQQSAGQMVTDYFIDWVTTADRAFLVLFGAVFAGVLVLLMPVFAVVSYAITHWGFSLRDRDGSLVAERGLFTRRSVTLEKRRIRGYELQDNPLERTRGVVGLRAIVTGLGDAATRAVLLPVGPRSTVEPVVDRALTLFRGRLVRHPRAALFRRLTRAVLPFAAVASVAAYFDVTWLAVAAGALALLGVPLGIDRYRSLGHGYDGERVSVRSGSLSRSQATVERSAVIGWTWTQTLFQRRSSLANLQVTVGAGTGGYTAQDAALDGSVAFAARITPEMVRPFLAGEEQRGPGDGAGEAPRG